MTRALLLMRHAKSDWSAGCTRDIDRPLNRRGRKAAKRMGRFLSGADREPDLAITSPARRATETLRLAHRAGAWSCPTVTEVGFYGHGPPEVVQVLRTSIPAAAGVVLAIGHEPTWSTLLEILTGASVRFPTGAVARIELDVHDWSDLAGRTGHLAWLVPPRLISAGR